MSIGLYEGHRDYFSGRMRFAPIVREECWKCGRPNPDLAHHVYEYVAALLAARIWVEFERHLDEHGCVTPGSPNYVGGIVYCDEAVALFALLPAGEQIIIG